jgi:DNA-binding CsgD family transcriptional regulator
VDAVLTVHAGGRWVPAALVRSATAPAPAALSPRQVEVLEPLAQGLSNKEIAAVLGFTADGAKAHLKAIYARRQRCVPTVRRAGGLSSPPCEHRRGEPYSRSAPASPSFAAPRLPAGSTARNVTT